MIIQSLFDSVDLPEDISFPQFMLNKLDSYGDRVAMVGDDLLLFLKKFDSVGGVSWVISENIKLLYYLNDTGLK